MYFNYHHVLLYFTIHFIYNNADLFQKSFNPTVHWSFMALIKTNQLQNNICGGALISPRWVLTSLYCLFDVDAQDTVYLYFRVYIQNEIICIDRKMEYISQIDYDMGTGVNGIAMIKLNKDVKIARSPKLLRISDNKYKPEAAESCRILIWKNVTDSNGTCGFPVVFDTFEVKIKHFSICELLGYTTVVNTKLCIFHNGAILTNSLPGGILVCESKLFGLIGPFVENPKLELIGANLAYYREWIIRARDGAEGVERSFAETNSQGFSSFSRQYVPLFTCFFVYLTLVISS